MGGTCDGGREEGHGEDDKEGAGELGDVACWQIRRGKLSFTGGSWRRWTSPESILCWSLTLDVQIMNMAHSIGRSYYYVVRDHILIYRISGPLSLRF